MILTIVVHGHNGSVLQLGDRFNFNLKAVIEFEIMGELGRKHLQGDIAIGCRVVGDVDGSRAAACKLLIDFVTAEFIFSHVINPSSFDRIAT